MAGRNARKTPTGRPSSFTETLAHEICAELAMGKSLRSVCKSAAMPALSTVFKWLAEQDGFSEQYVRAKQESADAHHEILSDLGDLAIELAKQLPGQQAAAAVQPVRLKADNIKWSMSKMKPKKYGDKLDVTSDGERLATAPVIISEITPRPSEDAPAQAKAS